MTRNNTPGRLNRESNPQSGTVPGFTPQYFEADGHARDVSADHPYPVKDDGAKTELEALKQRQQDIDNKIQTLVENQGNVSIDNLPDNQNVSDSDVLSAIQSLQQENETIKQTMSDILERLDGTFDTQLTGRNVEGLYERNTYTSMEPKIVDIPSYGKGFLLFAHLHNFSGDFSEGEGFNLRCQGLWSNFSTIHLITSAFEAGSTTSSSGSSLIAFHPEPIPDDFFVFRVRQHEVIQSPLTFRRLRIAPEITGDFSEGEGVETEISILWL